MKVFISWSGKKSQSVAEVLKDWLPSVIQAIEPYVSIDIDKGARWFTDIAGELAKSSFGILCITKDNVNAPWLNFEAGALSKDIDKSRVCPFLFGIKRSEVQDPIAQFQSTIFEKDDVFKLVKTLNLACEENGENVVEESKINFAFDELWWPHIQKKLGDISIEGTPAEDEAGMAVPTNKHSEKLLEDILEVTRTNQRLIANPETFLPPEYIRQAMQSHGPRANESESLEYYYRQMRSLSRSYIRLLQGLEEWSSECTEENKIRCKENIVSELIQLGAPLEGIMGRLSEDVTPKAMILAEQITSHRKHLMDYAT